MYYQYELTHFKGDMGHGVASDVVPGRIADDDAILLLGYHGRKEAVSLSLCKMGGLQFCECPPQLVFESVDGFGHDDARDPRYRIFLSDEHFVRPAFGGFACHPLSTLLVM